MINTMPHAITTTIYTTVHQAIISKAVCEGSAILLALSISLSDLDYTKLRFQQNTAQRNVH